MRTQMIAARASALFASNLPSGSRPTGSMVDDAIATAVRAFGGTRGCVAVMAAAYGDCPETAAPRMQWARSVVMTVYGSQSPEPERELVAA
ncbi:hypothetical protein [Actinoplanes aureus]|uniref:Uncharacterized protein n=1 Tax=Actinoplanes aureus TaxID=2792083 RepID=A0A931CCM1_9ACTN|nr:hypothetical protein [Actinoplanes aureus]MBG0564997.1 hypothetical protein [Actinoplanes aureus]